MKTLQKKYLLMGLSFLALTSSTHAMFSPGHPTEDEPNSPPRRPLVLLSSNADSQQDPFTTPQKQHQAADPEATPRPRAADKTEKTAEDLRKQLEELQAKNEQTESLLAEQMQQLSASRAASEMGTERSSRSYFTTRTAASTAYVANANSCLEELANQNKKLMKKCKDLNKEKKKEEKKLKNAEDQIKLFNKQTALLAPLAQRLYLSFQNPNITEGEIQAQLGEQKFKLDPKALEATQKILTELLVALPKRQAEQDEIEKKKQALLEDKKALETRQKKLDERESLQGTAKALVKDSALLVGHVLSNLEELQKDSRSCCSAIGKELSKVKANNGLFQGGARLTSMTHIEHLLKEFETAIIAAIANLTKKLNNSPSQSNDFTANLTAASEVSETLETINEASEASA